MLTPNQFLTIYGQAGVRQIIIAPAFFYIVEPSYDRYLFGIWASTTYIRILPNLENVTPFTSYNFTPFSSPFLLSHSQVGSLVNISWRIDNLNTFEPAFVIIIDGRMKDGRKNV